MTPAELAGVHARAMDTGPAWTEADFAGLLASAGVFSAGDDRGIVLGRVAADEAELLTLAVLPEHRRCGLGRGLLALFEEDAQRRGAAIAHLEVDAGNAAAISLYARRGYVEVGRRKGYYRAGDGSRSDAVLMSRTLADDAAQKAGEGPESGQKVY
jgi:ribosomal-protein-alanine N-acetyltransferase